MIVTKKKPSQDIISALSGHHKIFIAGCSDCATTSSTGGEKEVAEMKIMLESKGFHVSGTKVIEVPCDERINKVFSRKAEKELKASDAVLVLSCGSGVQTLANVLPLPVVSGLDSLFVGSVERIGQFNEFCSLCGDCLLNETSGVCVVTRCAKGLVNGPCGGSVRGMCEVDPDNECVWVTLYKKTGRATTPGRVIPARNNIRSGKPHRVKVVDV